MRLNIKNYKVETKTILFFKELENFMVDNEEYTAYRFKLCRITTVNGQIVRNVLLTYQDWAIGKTYMGAEQAFNRYYSYYKPLDEIRRLSTKK